MTYKKYKLALRFFLASIVWIISSLATKVLAEEINPSQFMGPFTSGNSYPFVLSYINPNPETANTQTPGTLTISLLETYANSGYRNFGPELSRYAPANTAVDADYEASSTLLRLRYSPIRQLDIFAETALHAYNTGIFDPSIQAFHKFFGFPNGGREHFSDNVLSIKIWDLDGTWLEYTSSALTIPWVQIGAKYELVPTTAEGTAFSVTSILKIPLSKISTIFESRSLDWVILFNIDQSIGPVKLSANLGLALLGESDFIPSEYLYHLIIPFSFNFELLLDIFSSLVFTVDASSSPFTTGHPKLDGLMSCFMLGLKFRLAPELVMEIGFQEEFISFNSPDIGAFIGFDIKIPLHVEIED